MKLLSTVAAAGLLAIGFAGAAHATPVTLTMNVNIWHGTNPAPGNSSDPTMQALPSNPITSQTFVGDFDFTAPVNFVHMDQSTDFIDTFLPIAGLPHTIMSTPTFADATLFEFTFIAPAGMTNASITHDDGISLFDITTSSGNLLPGNSAPTTAVTNDFSFTAGHNYEIWYEATNGAPSIFTIDGGTTPVPEPTTLALLGGSLALLGLVRRRRSA